MDCTISLDSSWNVMAHGDELEGKSRGKCRMEWVASTLHSTSELVYPALLPLMRTPQLPIFDWTDAHADLNGLVRLAERRNLVSARVTSHFNWPLPSVAFTDASDKPYTLFYVDKYVCPKDSWSVLLTKYYSGDQMKKNKMGGACSTYGGEESLVRKPVRKRPLRRTMGKCVDDIKP